MPTGDRTIRFENVSKFYGEVLGVNQVNLTLDTGITGLVGPNGSGKTTMMNLMTGLLWPSHGSLEVLGLETSRPELLFERVGYCTQYDSFPRGLSGYQFIYSYLRVHGRTHSEADRMTWEALERVKLTDAAKRKVAGYSKGMRQRVKLAQSISHDPQVLVLDEPLDGLDPMARADVIGIFQELAEAGRHVIISSHILHEVDMISDRVVLLSSGYVVAEGDIHGVRDEMEDRPVQVLVRCDKPAEVASVLFQKGHLVEAQLNEDGGGLLVRTRRADDFYRQFNQIVLELDVRVQTVTVADSDVRAVYEYLIGNEGDAMNRALMLRQLVGTMRLEIRRSLFAKRSLAVYFLAFAPVGIVALWAMSPFPRNEFSGVQEASTIFAVIFELYLRVSIFFSSLFLFVNLYRAEILEKSLHYYFLAPVRREVVAAGKYLAALAVSCGIFIVSTTVLFVLTTIPWGWGEFSAYVFSGPGLGNLMAYLSSVILGCAGYGAIFLVVGLVFRNPVIPAAILWIWEAANILLPPLLKKFSVIFYLQALYPVQLTKSLFEVVAEPPPAWIAVLGAIVVTLAVLALAGWRVRSMEVSYGGD